MEQICGLGQGIFCEEWGCYCPDLPHFGLSSSRFQWNVMFVNFFLFICPCWLGTFSWKGVWTLHLVMLWVWWPGPEGIAEILECSEIFMSLAQPHAVAGKAQLVSQAVLPACSEQEGSLKRHWNPEGCLVAFAEQPQTAEQLKLSIFCEEPKSSHSQGGDGHLQEILLRITF